MINDLEASGVEVRYRDSEALAYAPGVRPGEPGQIILNKDASISALRHEYQHFLDDKALGFQGMRGLYDPNFRVMTEANAYMVEIKAMQEAGQDAIVKQLAGNFEKEMTRVVGDFGEVTDEAVQALAQSILKLL